MTTIEMEQKISDVFSGGEILCREVRLSDEEAEYVRGHFAAKVLDMGGQWYQLTFKRGLCHE